MAKSRATKKQEHILREFDKLARRLGLRVSYGNLRFAGLKLKGGQCLFKGEKWVVIDRQQPYEDQLDVFREAVIQFDLTGEEILPELKVLLGLPILAATATTGNLQ
jgi:hypothetical protein